MSVFLFKTGLFSVKSAGDTFPFSSWLFHEYFLTALWLNSFFERVQSKSFLNKDFSWKKIYRRKKLSNQNRNDVDKCFPAL